MSKPKWLHSKKLKKQWKKYLCFIKMCRTIIGSLQIKICTFFAFSGQVVFSCRVPFNANVIIKSVLLRLDDGCLSELGACSKHISLLCPKLFIMVRGLFKKGKKCHTNRLCMCLIQYIDSRVNFHLLKPTCFNMSHFRPVLCSSFS